MEAIGNNPNVGCIERDPQVGRGRGPGQGCGRVAGAQGRGRGRGQAAHARVNVQPTLENEAKERATLHVAIDNLGAQQQYTLIQVLAEHQGTKFQLLIDCGSTYSFLSPKCLRKLGLNQVKSSPLIVELANRKEVLSCYVVGKLNFKLGGNSTSAFFTTLPIGMYGGILDWLIANSTSIQCASHTLTYKNKQDHEILIQGKNNAPKVKLVKANRLIKGARARQQVYIFKLNKVDESKDSQDLLWL